MSRKTALYETHVKEGGKIVEFGGYLLPVQYGTGVIKEHMAVREACGIFDVSHMGEVTFKGKGALKSLNHILTNDFTNMPVGKVRYSLMCYEDGGIVDDLLVYKFGDEDYLVVVNASNREKDVEHMKKYLLEDTEFKDISDEVSQIALQGPKAKEVLKKLVNEEDIPQKYYSAKRDVCLKDKKVLISTTGYTGEGGYEIYAANEDIADIWEYLKEAGEEYGLIPCGLGARDTLRLEAGMPLYGHEMDETITPFETNLQLGIKMNKEEFVGKKALEEKGEALITRVGLEAVGKGILREHQDIYLGEEKIGHTSSGTYAPYLKKAIAMALIDKRYAAEGTVLSVDVRGRRVDAKVIPLPFYKKSY